MLAGTPVTVGQGGDCSGQGDREPRSTPSLVCNLGQVSAASQLRVLLCKRTEVDWGVTEVPFNSQQSKILWHLKITREGCKCDFLIASLKTTKIARPASGRQYYHEPTLSISITKQRKCIWSVPEKSDHPKEEICVKRYQIMCWNRKYCSGCRWPFIARSFTCWLYCQVTYYCPLKVIALGVPLGAS